MGILNTLKDAASGLLEVADQKLSKAVDSAATYLSAPVPEPQVDLVEMLNNLIYDQKKYKKAIGICKSYLHDDDPLVKAQAYNYRAVCYMFQAEECRTSWSQYSEEERTADDFGARLDAADNERTTRLKLALKDIDLSLKICLDNELSWYDIAALDKAHILNDLYELPEARRWYIYCMDSVFEGVRSEARSCYEEVTERMINLFNYFTILSSEDEDVRHFDDVSEEDKAELIEINHELAEERKFSNKYQYGDRQFLLVVKSPDKIAGCYDPEENINWVFTQDQLPADLSFPIGHPQTNTLYIAHPAQKGLYLPFEGAEEKIFHEKVEDFCRLAQCLGAREISFRSLKGESVSEGLSSRIAVGGDVGVKGNSVGVNTLQGFSATRSSTRQDEVGYSFVLQPTKAYVPKDLAWLEIDKSWQTFVKQRLEGNLLSYTKKISSSETLNMSKSSAFGVKSSFDTLMLKINANYDIENDETFSHDRSTEWEILISFAPLEELEHGTDPSVPDVVPAAVPSGQDVLSAEEERYKEEVLFILEDGEITETERRFLDRKRLKLGLTKEQAAKVEALCVPSMTDSEKEYLEVYKEIIGEDPISDRKRRMLNREAELLGISPERVCELEETMKK